MSRARTRFRLRRWAVRLLGAVSVAALGGAMLAAVERGSQARQISQEISRLEEREAAVRSRVADAMRAVDSLSSRDRIARAAARLGLRPARDDEITFLRARTPERDGRSGDR